MSHRIRTLVRVEGIVQGVGFRPFVYSLATGLGLSGLVGNDTEGVFAEVEGAPETIEAFVRALATDAPPLASVERIATSPLPPDGSTTFAIAPSQAGGPGRRSRTLISPDMATCADCLAELSDPASRRYRYAFTNCTNCGPRFTIVAGIPYDRPLTTMAGFAMCAACAREYHDPADRRFHAQPVCCPACGPRLRLTDRDGTELPAADPIHEAAKLLAGGMVLAVKGLGGYHLSADATCEPAVAALRARKHREDKPFAVLAADLDQASSLVSVDEVAAGLLTGPRRPIVLLPARPGAPVAPSVAPGNRYLGVLLPYTPLHHLLVREAAFPLVLTSGNVSDEPICYEDEEAVGRLAGIADAFLVHDRPIYIRADDSVVRSFRGLAYPVRRARGYAPEPLRLAFSADRPVLACGAELKSTFCLASGGRAFVSPHIGDLENLETLVSYRQLIEHYGRLFDTYPAVLAHDLHPDYLSTGYARQRAAEQGLPLTGVQHHHAHIASCLADNGAGRDERVIGVAFDGTGYGTDGTIWGGEFLTASLTGFERTGHLGTVPMPGGAAAIRQPWRMAAAYLDAAALAASPAGSGLRSRHEDQWAAVLAMARRGINAPLTSSAGRLFDAVAALLGVRDTVSYEGQAAAELEQLADPGHDGWYPAHLGHGEGAAFVARGTDLIAAAAADLAAGVAGPVIAARFHHGLARLIVAGCDLVRDRAGLGTVALSGGVFQNVLLLTEVTGRLEAAGFTVLTHTRVPCNDGGISLGQAAVAASQSYH
ncbi:MAG TPA: carbamoyltransferase HypF [Streptosporangiaceae bacterium]